MSTKRWVSLSKPIVRNLQRLFSIITVPPSRLYAVLETDLAQVTAEYESDKIDNKVTLDIYLKSYFSFSFRFPADCRCSHMFQTIGARGTNGSSCLVDKTVAE
jgi:hypothetical protein